jgi:hypothetical protein
VKGGTVKPVRCAIMTPERISRSTRTVHGLVLCSYPSQALTLLPPRRLVACIIAMSVELRKIGEATRGRPCLPIAPN